MALASFSCFLILLIVLGAARRELDTPAHNGHRELICYYLRFWASAQIKQHAEAGYAELLVLSVLRREVRDCFLSRAQPQTLALGGSQSCSHRCPNRASLSELLTAAGSDPHRARCGLWGRIAVGSRLDRDRQNQPRNRFGNLKFLL